MNVGRGGFTLIEMLAVMLAVSLLLTVALDVYVGLSRDATRAVELTRGMRRAAAILDRVASDLEHALLVTKPEEMDPLSHPWLFLAEPLYAENGSDRLKFVRRVTPRSLDGSASDLAVVAYTLRPSPDEEGSFALYRWSWPELPEGLDRDFPLEDDPDSLLLADGLASFALRFLDANTGEWLTRWDSSLLGESSLLPLVVEIEVSVVGDLSEDPDALFEEETALHTRQVRLPVRPLDLVALLDPGEEGEGEAGDDEEGEDGATVGDCLGPEDVEDIAEAFGISVPEAEVYLARNQDMPWSEAIAQAPALAEFGFCP